MGELSVVVTAKQDFPAKVPELSLVRPEKDKAQAPSSQGVEVLAPPKTGHMALLGYLFTGIVLYAGWQMRDIDYIVAESGAGYALGIIGGVMMLLLLLYPLRKKASFMRNWGPVKYWFRAHMMMGILGPVFILFHANFRIGSTNSTVALVVTLGVAVSGLAGRYMYTKIHYGFYGREITLKELQSGLEAKKTDAATILGYAPTLQRRLLELADRALSRGSSIIAAALKLLEMWVMSIWSVFYLGMGLRRAITVASSRYRWTNVMKEKKRAEALGHIRAHVKAAKRVVEFSFFERLSGLWHMFHLPFFILLIIVTVFHVIAVHMY